MRDRKNTITAVVAGLLVLTVIAAAVTCAVSARRRTATGAAALTAYWAPDSAAAQDLRDYVIKVTDPNDKANYIPEKDRIAVFDMDGNFAKCCLSPPLALS